MEELGDLRDAEVHQGPLSLPQEWMLELDTHWAADQSAIMMACALNLDGRLSVPALEEALNESAEVHSALRTAFPGRRLQAVSQARPRLRIVDQGPDSFAEVLAQEVAEPINVEGGPTFRASLIGRDSEHVLLCIVHHATFDRRSWGLTLSDWASRYAARLDQTIQPPSTRPPPSQIDYAREQNSPPVVEQRRLHTAYWCDKFGLDPLAIMELESAQGDGGAPPTLVPRTFLLPDTHLADRVRSCAGRARVTPFMVLLAAHAIFASAWSDEWETVIHTTRDDRPGTRFARTIGCLAGLLLLKIRVDEDASVSDFLATVRQEVTSAIQHRNVHPLVLARIRPRAFEFYYRDAPPGYNPFGGVSAREFGVHWLKRGSNAMPLTEYKPVLAAECEGARVRVMVTLDSGRHDEGVFPVVAEMFFNALLSVVQPGALMGDALAATRRRATKLRL